MFKTHYDANDRRPRDDDYTLEPDEIDRHGKRYARYDEMEAELTARAAASIIPENIVYIKGVAYELASYGEAYADGSRSATLRLWRPF